MAMKTNSVSVIFGLIILMFSSPVFAQDTNFWTQQYGTRSTLLGGAVIGSVEDLGAIYYNPGLFALLEDPGFLLSAKVFMNSSVKIEDGAGQGRDLKRSKFGGVPGLLVGSFSIDRIPNHQFGYSLLTRQMGTFSFTTKARKDVDIIPNWPGDELYGGEVIYSQSLNDIWAGLTWGYKFKDNFGIGLSQFLSVRSKSLSSRILLEALGNNGNTASAIETDEYNYKSYRTLTKIGLGLSLSQFSAGVTITTPSLHISGSGSSLYNDLVTGGDLDGDGISDDYLEARLQHDIPAEFKTSWAVGFGTGFMIAKRVRFHLTGEWFDKIDKYRILETQPFVGQSTGDTLSHDITYETESIFNYGIGFELYTSSKFTWYGSYVTDFSGTPGKESATTISGIDLTHLSGGTSFTIGRSEFTLGLSWAFGEQEVPRLVDFNVEDPGDDIRDPEASSLVKASRLKFIVGFAFAY
jgi:hypothetical protein